MTISKAEQTETPFTIIFDEETGKWLIALGNQIVCEKNFDDQNLAINYINSKPWDLILTACAAMVNNTKQMTTDKR